MPARSNIYVELGAAGYVPTAYSGTSGTADFEMPYGQLGVMSEGTLDATRATFSACPDKDEVGGVQGCRSAHPD